VRIASTSEIMATMVRQIRVNGITLRCDEE